MQAYYVTYSNLRIYFVTYILMPLDSQLVARMGEKRNAYRLFVGKQEGKRPLERPRRRWVDNIRMDLEEEG
jgi:hypothetical protein